MGRVVDAGVVNDANGGALIGGGRTNVWDGRNRLVQCTYQGTTSAFTYGPDATDYALDGGVATYPRAKMTAYCSRLRDGRLDGGVAHPGGFRGGSV